MPDLGTQIATARQAGYSDADITAYLAKDPGMGPKVAQAKAAGYEDADIVSHLSAPAKPANAFAHAAQIAGDEFHKATDAYKADIQSFAQKGLSGQGHSPMDYAAPVLDVVRAAAAPIKGVADAAFGDKSVALPFGINSRGLSGGDIATMVIPAAGEMAAGRQVAAAAKAAGVGADTMKATIASSKAPVSIARTNPTPAAPTNDLAAKVQAFDKAGVRPTMAAMGDGSARVAKGIAENPLAGIRTRSALQGSLADTSAAVDRTANAYGSPAARGAAGEAVQQGVQDFNARFTDRAGALYDKAFAPINEAHAAAAAKARQDYSLAKVQTADEAQNAQAALNLDYRNRTAQALHAQTQAEIDARRAADLKSAKGGQQATAEPVPKGYVYPADTVQPSPQPAKQAVIAPSTTTATLDRINSRGDSPALRNLFSTPQVQTLTAAMKNPASLSFQDLRDARTWVRNAQRDDTLRQGVSQGDLQQLETSLTQDINSNAEAIAGPKAARALQQADQFYRLGSQRIQGSLQAFVGKGGNASGESAYDLIQRAASDRGGADTARLTALKASLKPSEWGDVAASTIQRMAQGKGGDFSVNSFVTNADTLSPQGKDLLFGRGELRSELDNLVKVAKMQKGVEQAANHSNTAASAQGLGTVAGLANPHTTIPTLGALGGMAVTGEILTNPAAVRWLARVGKAQAVSPAATSSAVGRLGSAAGSNSTLVPLYQQALKLVPGPATRSAAQGSPAQPTQ